MSGRDEVGMKPIGLRRSAFVFCWLNQSGKARMATGKAWLHACFAVFSPPFRGPGPRPGHRARFSPLPFSEGGRRLKCSAGGVGLLTLALALLACGPLSVAGAPAT